MTRKRCNRTVRPVYNPFLVARNHATLLTADELATMATPLRAAAERMRRGLASADDWALLSGSLQMARTIEAQGVVRGLAGHLDEIDRALVAIEARATQAGAWQAPTLYFHELDAVRLLLDLHLYQLQHLTFGEFRRAHDITAAQMRSRGVQVLKLSEVGHG